MQIERSKLYILQADTPMFPFENGWEQITFSWAGDIKTVRGA